MEFRILGPLEVADGERLIEIAAPKQRLLLTVLALTPGRVVSADRLLDELWGDSPPSGGVKTLHYHVSKLRDTLQPERKTGEEGVIVTRPPGYALLVPSDDVDAVRFEREVREARRLIEFDPGHAAARLREALALWRGPLPAELLDAPLAGLEARRLEELRLSALEDRIGAYLAAGRHAEVVPELDALTAENPLRERLWAQYMVALYRSDRQAEALRAYRALSLRLDEELGIEPSPDLKSPSSFRTRTSTCPKVFGGRPACAGTSCENGWGKGRSASCGAPRRSRWSERWPSRWCGRSTPIGRERCSASRPRPGCWPPWSIRTWYRSSTSGGTPTVPTW